MDEDRLRVEIWSDVACPFCWLGKRRFEEALARFERPDLVDVEWKSFQLAPDLRTDPTVRVHEHVARK
jgi:predicted DsbA family dithiol-disulfide isomerase